MSEKKLWIPDGASPAMEEEMERKDVPEEDRDEVRRFAEVLRRMKDRKEGKAIPPSPEGMEEWIKGEL